MRVVSKEKSKGFKIRMQKLFYAKSHQRSKRRLQHIIYATKNVMYNARWDLIVIANEKS